jgi:polyphosphate glucokinase
VTVINDADAAGLAEMRYGTARDQLGTVIMLTFGTGIGSAMFLDGKLIPNSELGHVQLDGTDAEHWASAKAQEEEKLSFKAWAKRVTRYLNHLDFLFSPELFVVGGGISKESDKWVPLLRVRPRVEVAKLRNHAGIVGAALAAVEARLPKAAGDPDSHKEETNG